MMGPVYTVEATAKLVEELAASPFVKPTSSSIDGTFVVNHTPGSVEGGYGLRDPQIPSLPQYGLHITDFSVKGEKTKVVVIGGTHAREQSASHMLEAFLRKLTDDSPEMRELRQMMEFFVYPQINPEGRYAYNLPGNPHGIERDAPSNLGKGAYDEDLNRVWHDPEGWPQIEAIQRVILRDTGGSATMFFDFHARSFSREEMARKSPPEQPKQVWVGSRTKGGMYIHDLTRRDPEIEVIASKERKHPETGSAWAMSERGLKVRWSIVPEVARDEPVDFYRPLGQVYALALYDWMKAPLP
jgi:hypothetical protein